MKILIITFLILFVLLGCSTIPDEYLREPNESELVYIKAGAIWGIVFTGLCGYTYYYLDEKAEWF